MKLARRLLLQLSEMAQYDRKAFNEKLTEKISGATREFCKYAIAELNGEVKWVYHWKTEVERLVNEAASVYATPISGFKDRKKVLAEVVLDFKAENSKGTYTRMAKNTFFKYYQRDAKASISKSDISSFLDKVADAIEHGHILALHDKN